MMQRRKLIKLWIKQRDKSPDCVKKYSKRKLTIAEEALRYGLNHHILPKNFDKNNMRANIFFFFFMYLFSFLLTINLKLIKVHVEIKIVNKEAATKRSTLLQLTYTTNVVHGRRTFEQSDVMLIRKGKRKEDN